MTEPGNANPTTIDQINRYGGSTSPSLPWPEDDTGDDDVEAKFEKLQKLLVKALARLSKGAGAGAGKGASGLGAVVAVGLVEILEGPKGHRAPMVRKRDVIENKS